MVVVMVVVGTPCCSSCYDCRNHRSCRAHVFPGHPSRGCILLPPCKAIIALELLVLLLVLLLLVRVLVGTVAADQRFYGVLRAEPQSLRVDLLGIAGHPVIVFQVALLITPRAGAGG